MVSPMLVHFLEYLSMKMNRMKTNFCNGRNSSLSKQLVRRGKNSPSLALSVNCNNDVRRIKALRKMEFLRTKMVVYQLTFIRVIRIIRTIASHEHI